MAWIKEVVVKMERSRFGIYFKGSMYLVIDWIYRVRERGE